MMEFSAIVARPRARVRVRACVCCACEYDRNAYSLRTRGQLFPLRAAQLSGCDVGAYRRRWERRRYRRRWEHRRYRRRPTSNHDLESFIEGTLRGDDTLNAAFFLFGFLVVSETRSKIKSIYCSLNKITETYNTGAYAFPAGDVSSVNIGAAVQIARPPSRPPAAEKVILFKFNVYRQSPHPAARNE
ncbi:hypothetical protein EVAR_103483_1 [Eumeta japonica]|uniref:Uncharacterized protein n=1 Tax=Eumeta variegata TaxID=151549 RepID=A0A4C1ZJR2_EUMVA|nr:hypothetical protein EVAR_103483_1 [Eumeta japonica]